MPLLPPERAIYQNNSEEWLKIFWKSPLTADERRWLLDGYDEFYFTLTQLIDTHRFNIIFDGHTMMDAPLRPVISFGTEHIPKFYMPVVKSMREKMKRLGYSGVVFNQPFGGGHILSWCKERFPDVFICSMKINKKLYMGSAGGVCSKRLIKRLSDDLVHIFDIEDEPDTLTVTSEKKNAQKVLK